MSALFVEKLSTIDFSYLCPERGVVGETWLVDVVLSGELNDEGMVFDFGHVKKEIKAMIDASADHALLVPTQHNSIQLSEQNGYREVTMPVPQGGTIRCRAPQQAILPLPVEEISPESVRPLLENHILAGLPANVSSVQLTLYPEDIPGAFYHYSHGLKKHSGDCQRIAHGHRSPIKIFVGEQRNSTLEQETARLWQDIYIATREDLKLTSSVDTVEHFTFAYQAQQGSFELQLPSTHCYLMETDTTVELLASHLAEKLGKEQPGKTV